MVISDISDNNAFAAEKSFFCTGRILQVARAALPRKMVHNKVSLLNCFNKL